MQARVEEVGQALLRRTQDVGGLGPRRKGKRNQHHTDAYEEHVLLPEVAHAALALYCSTHVASCSACAPHAKLHILLCMHHSST